MSLTTSLVSYWKLDESSGNPQDSHGSNHGTLNGSVAYGSGKLNNCAQFTGGYLDFGQTASLRFTGATAFTFSFWIKTNTAENAFFFGEGDIDTNGAGTVFNWSSALSTAKVRFQFVSTVGGGISLDSAAQIKDGNWHHVVVTYDGSTNGTGLKMYIDGTLDATGTGTGNITGTFHNANDEFIIGSREGGNQPVTAHIDEAGVWSRELTSGEVTTLYGAGTPPAYPFANNYTQSVNETVTLVDSISKGAGKSLNEAITLVDTQTKATAKSLSEVVTLVDTLTANMFYTEDLNEILALNDVAIEAKIVGKTLDEVLPIADTIRRDMTRIFSETATLVDTLTKQIALNKTFNEEITLLDSISKQAGKTLNEFVELIDSISTNLAYSRSLTEVAVLVDTISKGAGKVLNEVTTLVDTLARVGTFARTLSETVTLVEYFQGLYNGLNIRWIRKYSSNAKEFTAKYSTKAVTWIKKYLDIP